MEPWLTRRLDPRKALECKACAPFLRWARFLLEGSRMRIRLLVSLVLLTSCGAETAETELEPIGSQELAGLHDQGLHDQGLHDQGLHDQGTDLVIERISYANAALNSRPLTNVHIEQGELVASQPIVLTGTTRSFGSCSWFNTLNGVARNCGWKPAGLGACTPGAAVTVSFGACNLGWGTGDSMMRVCSGTSPCEYNSSLRIGASDNACSTVFPRSTFTCPASGVFNVMAASVVPNKAYGYSVGVSGGVFPAPPRVLRGTALTGTELIGKTRATPTQPSLDMPLKIRAITAPDGTGSLPPEGKDETRRTYRYEIDYGEWVINKTGALAEGPVWRGNACIATRPRASDGATFQYAIPLRGVWTANGGRLSPDPGTDFTFACMSGVIAKCYAWGFRPHASTNHAETHQACTRMARADYCGKGEPHTVAGTTINFEDRMTPIVSPYETALPYSQWPFEAGWTPAGAVCLSKYRWEHLPVAPGNPLCPDPSHGPYRVDTSGPIGTSPRYLPNVCNTEAEAIQFGGGNLRLYNHSAPNP